MLLTGVQMAKLLGVSRVTYYTWVKQDVPKIRKGNDKRIRGVLRELLATMQGGWPADEVKGLTSDKRFEKLLELMPTGE